MLRNIHLSLTFRNDVHNSSGVENSLNYSPLKNKRLTGLASLLFASCSFFSVSIR